MVQVVRILKAYWHYGDDGVLVSRQIIMLIDFVCDKCIRVSYRETLDDFMWEYGSTFIRVQSF